MGMSPRGRGFFGCDDVTTFKVQISFKTAGFVLCFFFLFVCLTGSLWERWECCPWCWTSLHEPLRRIHFFLLCCNSNWFTLLPDHFGTSSSCSEVWLFIPHSSLLPGHLYISLLSLRLQSFQRVVFDLTETTFKISQSHIRVYMFGPSSTTQTCHLSEDFSLFLHKRLAHKRSSIHLRCCIENKAASIVVTSHIIAVQIRWGQV